MIINLRNSSFLFYEISGILKKTALKLDILRMADLPINQQSYSNASVFETNRSN